MGVFQRQGGNTGFLKLGHCTHHIKRVTNPMISVADDWDLTGPPDSRNLFDVFIQREQRYVRCSEHLKRGDGTALDGNLKTKVGCHTNRDRIEYGRSKFTRGSLEQITKRLAQFMMRSLDHFFGSTQFIRGLLRDEPDQEITTGHGHG